MVKQAADLNAEIEKLSNRLLRGDISDDQRKAIEALLNSYNDLLGVIDNTIQDITGTTINDLGRNLAEAFLTGENAAEAWGEKVDDIIKNVIIRQLTTNLLSGKITEAVNTLVNDSASGEELTTEEAANFKKLMDELYASSAPVFEAKQKALSAAGFNLGNASGSAASGLSGSVKGASEETTAALVGQLMAVRVDVKELIKYSAMGQDDVAKSLLYLRQISDNTSYNKELIPISKKLENIENVLRSRL
jgi:hypothetical protein